MTDRADDRDSGFEDGVGQAFLIEGPKILGASAPAADDHHIDVDDLGDMKAVEQPDGRGDFRAGAVSLNPHRINPDVHCQPAARQNFEHVAHGRPGRTRDQHQPARELRQRPFSRRFKITKLGELVAELAKGQLQSAHALRLNVLDNALVLSVRRIDLDSSAGDHLQPVLKLELQSGHGGFPNHCRKLCFFVFQSGVEMPRRGRTTI